MKNIRLETIKIILNSIKSRSVIENILCKYTLSKNQLKIIDNEINNILNLLEDKIKQYESKRN